MNILFCTAPHGPADRTGYDHGLVALAEGLRVLNRGGADFRWSGTVPYWRLSPEPEDWLIPSDGRVNWANADVVVISYLVIGDGGMLPPELDKLSARTKTVFLDAMDGWRTFFLRPEMRRFDLVLRTHLNKRYPSPANVRPWAFGLTERILEATTVHTHSRAPEVLFNFRVGHPLRDWARDTVLPGLSTLFAFNAETDAVPLSPREHLFWEQTGRRHYPEYFERLGRVEAGAAYGGYFAPDWRLSLNSPLLRLAYKVVNLERLQTRTIVQFDSWRFWETLAAGALTIHVNLDRYGAWLPEAPLDRVHYWSISPDRTREDIEELLSSSPEARRAIAEAGQLWAREQYSPEAQIRRLLKMLDLQE